MPVSVKVIACARGAILPLAPFALMPLLPAAMLDGGGVPLPMAAHRSLTTPLPSWRVGTVLYQGAQPMFRVTGRVLMPCEEVPHALICPLLQALVTVREAASLDLLPRRLGRSLAWITLSDKGHANLREDMSGPAIAALVAAHIPLDHQQGFLLPDDASALKALLVELTLGQGYDLVITTGGTGLGPRDVSPEATLPLIEKRLPGFEQAMMAASLAKTPHASISRAVAGVVGQSIIINTPGSSKAVVENLQALMPALPHALDKLHGDPADCGG